MILRLRKSCVFRQRAQIWIQAVVAIAAASLFSYSLLRCNMWKHTSKTGANTLKTSANARKSETCNNWYFARSPIMKRAFLGEQALVGSLGEYYWPEHFFCDTHLCNNGGSRETNTQDIGVVFSIPGPSTVILPFQRKMFFRASSTFGCLGALFAFY